MSDKIILGSTTWEGRGWGGVGLKKIPLAHEHVCMIVHEMQCTIIFVCVA